jgi:hypothetical protein
MGMLGTPETLQEKRDKRIARNTKGRFKLRGKSFQDGTLVEAHLYLAKKR